MAKLVSGTEKLTLQSALAGNKFDDLVGQDSLSALTSIVNSIKSVGATLLKTFGGPVADFLKQFTGPEGLENIKKQLIAIANIAIATFNAGRSFLNTFRFDKEIVGDVIGAGGVPSFFETVDNSGIKMSIAVNAFSKDS